MKSKVTVVKDDVVYTPDGNLVRSTGNRRVLLRLEVPGLELDTYLMLESEIRQFVEDAFTVRVVDIDVFEERIN